MRTQACGGDGGRLSEAGRRVRQRKLTRIQRLKHSSWQGGGHGMNNEHFLLLPSSTGAFSGPNLLQEDHSRGPHSLPGQEAAGRRWRSIYRARWLVEQSFSRFFPCLVRGRRLWVCIVHILPSQHRWLYCNHLLLAGVYETMIS